MLTAEVHHYPNATFQTTLTDYAVDGLPRYQLTGDVHKDRGESLARATTAYKEMNHLPEEAGVEMKVLDVMVGAGTDCAAVDCRCTCH